MSFLKKFLPGSLKADFSRMIQSKIVEPTLQLKLGRIYSNRTSVIKYISYEGDDNFVLPFVPKSEQTLPAPPPQFRLGYGKTDEEYLNSGMADAEFMHRKLLEHGYDKRTGQRVLDLGCGAARMLRYVPKYFAESELWGLDINANLIFWCKQNLGNTANFATATLTPHLPFESNYFDLIYCGSVFTHIDDLADLWLLEVRRVLKKGAMFYVTIHDESTVNLLQTEYKEHPLSVFLHSHKIYTDNCNRFGMLVIDRDNLSQVFYGRDYFRQMVSPLFEVLEFIDHAYGYQTGVVLRKK